MEQFNDSEIIKYLFLIRLRNFRFLRELGEIIKILRNIISDSEYILDCKIKLKEIENLNNIQN